MAAVLEWAGDDEEPVPSSFPSSQHRSRGRRMPAGSGELPPDIEAAIWRGSQLGVGADLNLTHPADSILTRGWTPTARRLAVDKCRSIAGSLTPRL